MAVPVSELIARASREADRLGPEPATARERIRWRERREDAAWELATLANCDAALLSQAARLAGDTDAHHAQELLRAATDWTPRGRGNR